MVDVVSYAKKNGFIWGPEPEIYGGVAGFYTYGPLGKLLKNNVENALRKVFTKNGFWEVECPILAPEIVWKASGHLDKFSDPVILCKKCKAETRVDKLLEEALEIIPGDRTKENFLKLIKKHNLKCPQCKSDFEDKILDHELMLKTKIELDKPMCVRPETATMTYLPFRNYYDFFRKKMPMKVFQIGKAFRNEISPRQNVMRGREFTQAEAQIFLSKDNKDKFEDFNRVKNMKLPLWSHQLQSKKEKFKLITLSQALKNKWLKNEAYASCLAVAYEFYLSLCIPPERIRFRQHMPDELAHYADDAWDLEVNLNTYGWYEMVGMHDRKDYDLNQHAKFANENFKVEGSVPHVLEIAFGSDRPTFALIDIFATEDKVNEEVRTLLKIPAKMAPIQVAVFPLVSKDGLPEIANEVFETLNKAGFRVTYDESGSIGKRYRRMDQIGTPLTVTVDYDSKKYRTLTLRERDSTKQIIIKIKDISKIIKDIISGEIAFAKAGKLIK